MQATLKNDWLHPNTDGYKVMGESIDLKLFTRPGTGVGDANLVRGFEVGAIHFGRHDDPMVVPFSIPRPGVVTLVVHSIQGKEIGRLSEFRDASGSQSMRFGSEKLRAGIYLYSLQYEHSTLGGKAYVPHGR